MVFFRVMDVELHEKTVRMGNTVVKGASMYPFFRETGEVAYLMVVLPREPRVFLLAYTKGIVHVHPWGAVHLGVTSDQLKGPADFQVKQLKGLFYYDRQGVLSEERFKTYWARDLLQQNNCAKILREQIGKEISHLRFTRDLSKLVSVSLRSKWLEARTVLAADGVLKSLTGSLRKAQGRWNETGNGQWMLDPVWQNWGKPVEWE